MEYSLQQQQQKPQQLTVFEVGINPLEVAHQ
jgi:hypothetical protein